MVFGVLLMLIGGFLTAKFIWNAHKIFGGNIFGVLSTTRLKGEDVGRVNILLAGNSADDVGHNGGQLTDSIMLISIDTRNNKAFMMSIPRDLYVKIPGNGHSKINSAYVYGEEDGFDESGYPKGGMGLLQKTVEDNLGIDINYYALVNYKALRQAVDAVGGIDYTVKSSDPRGLYDPNIDYKTHSPLVKLTNGPHHLNGQQALNLARARGDSYNSYGFAASDFDRTEHQRELIVALKGKAATAGVIANPAKISSLADAIGSNVKTDFSLSEVRRLYDISKKIPSKNITSVGLNEADGKNLLISYTAPGGQSALIPAAGLDDFSDIQAFLKRKTSSNPVVQEGAKIVILNGTTSNGLASAKKKSLSAKNLLISKTGDARTNQATTTVIDASGGKKPSTKKLLGQLYNNSFVTTNPYDGIYDADFIIILGSDQIPKTNSTRQ
jgi:LCP family protein required for cell wall assembly